VKGCLTFVLIALSGVALIIAGAIYQIFFAGDRPGEDLPARILELAGVIAIFAAIYGAAAWRFRIWWKTRHEPPDSPSPPL
jgi:hypothetical protein